MSSDQPSTPPKTTDAVPLPVGARYDPSTGADLLASGTGGGHRRGSYALQPGEPVASFNLVTSLLPLASGAAPQTYRWALALGALVPVVAGVLGYLAFAFVAAAVLVPILYLVYLYDVNQWEDEPLNVLIGAVVLAAALGVGFTFLWHEGILGDDVATLSISGHGAASVQWSHLLVLALLVPVVGEVLKEVGPLLLARRPLFDDMIDALTFGIAAGAAYAAAETIVVNRALFSSFGSIDHPDSGFWVSLILSAAIVKPIVYGAASGIAVASFSGLGKGYDGFGPGYLRGLGEALAANIVFQAGLFFTGRISGTSGAVLGLVWGALVAGALLVRLRYFLHFAVLEAALEASSTDDRLKDGARGTAYCPSCDMPLLADANFCVVCGTATRAGDKLTRARNRADDTAPDAAPAKPTLRRTADTTSRSTHRGAPVVVAAVVAVVLVAGAIGQAAAAAGADHAKPPAVPITLTPQPGAGPTTGPAPTPAPVPGPAVDPTSSRIAVPHAIAPGVAAFTTSPSAVPTATSPSPFDQPSTTTIPPIATPPVATTTPFGTPTETPSFPPVTTPVPTAPATPTTPTTPPTPTGGSAVDLGGGLGFAVPDGWTVSQQDAGFAEVDGPNGLFVASVDPPTATLQNMASEAVQLLQNSGVQQLQVAQPQQVNVPSSDVVQVFEVDYQGLLASQQSGSAPVNGFFFLFLLQDGRGVTATGLFAQGAITPQTPDTDPLVAAYNQMMSTLIGSM